MIYSTLLSILILECTIGSLLVSYMLVGYPDDTADNYVTVYDRIMDQERPMR